ncbi:hypothetical protein GCM10007972_27710 [Iodidimonas muriae]|uniref:Uncharacterized protein n=1 Tax=Iodidimonas muriae TaxID=261467 RepID=A0ABQ2LHF4_9PROT|nr:hypothetical protein [Iodidimonas muriae]GER08812.1 hypothetical protein JCM17843_31220 [Kordiimonadales bacterium JCM 17843]GGO17537.1 hypothetical protein GCM10007972_27710 [Iodidimonas muriae]
MPVFLIPWLLGGAIGGGSVFLLGKGADKVTKMMLIAGGLGAAFVFRDEIKGFIK